MRMVSVFMLALIAVAALAAGCICLPRAPSPTPAPTATPIPSPAPTATVTPVPTLPATSQVFMPQQTTNGRVYSNATATPIANGSKSPNTAGELGSQR